MREKTWKLVITFHTTTGAMAMEKYCKGNNLAGRLIPVPREIKAGCGMAWCAMPENRAGLEAAVASAGLDADGWYKLFL